MNITDQWLQNVVSLSEAARSDLALDPSIGRFADMTLPIPIPFIGSGEIKIVIIGQDPTVKTVKSRSKITTTLNLNLQGSLRSYLSHICEMLGLSLDHNAYATNLCKNFFIERPTEISKNTKIDVLKASSSFWRPVLLYELERFPNACVITLGEPLLTSLVKPEFPQQVAFYWGYNRKTKTQTFPFSAISAEASIFDRTLYPLPHQPSIRKVFYRDHIQNYVAFVKASHMGV